MKRWAMAFEFASGVLSGLMLSIFPDWATSCGGTGAPSAQAAAANDATRPSPPTSYLIRLQGQVVGGEGNTVLDLHAGCTTFQAEDEPNFCSP